MPKIHIDWSMSDYEIVREIEKRVYNARGMVSTNDIVVLKHLGEAFLEIYHKWGSFDE